VQIWKVMMLFLNLLKRLLMFQIKFKVFTKKNKSIKRSFNKKWMIINFKIKKNMKRKICSLLSNLSKITLVVIKLFSNHHHLKQCKILKLNLIKSKLYLFCKEKHFFKSQIKKIKEKYWQSVKGVLKKWKHNVPKIIFLIIQADKWVLLQKKIFDLLKRN
jgi:transcriptional regulator of heat shock response